MPDTLVCLFYCIYIMKEKKLTAVPGPTMKFEWTKRNRLGYKLMVPYISVSIEGSPFVDVKSIARCADSMLKEKEEGVPEYEEYVPEKMNI